MRSAPTRRRLWVIGAATVLAVGGLTVADAAPDTTTVSVTVPTDPYRILDTRKGIGTGGSTAPMGPDQTITLQVAGVGPVPANATGVVVNLTVTDGDQSGSYITAWPSGTPRQETSVINITAGQSIANMITTNLGDGQLDLYNFRGHVHLIADVAAYLLPAGEGGGVTGPQGPTGLQGPVGPPGPTAAAFAVSDHLVVLATLNTKFVVAQIGDAAQGSGKLTIDFPARLAISGTVRLSTAGLDPGTASCGLEVSGNGGVFQPVGVPSFADVQGGQGTNLDTLAVGAMVDRPPGTYDVWVVCKWERGNRPDAFATSLNVVAVAR